MRAHLFAILPLALLACSDDTTASGGAGAGGDPAGGGAEGGAAQGGAAEGGAGGGSPITGDFVAGGERPVTVQVPDGYDPEVPAPLMILLHGYSATGAIQEAYFGLGPIANEQGVVYANPDGTVDATGENFWNATEACCDFGGTDVDDSAYLLGLVDEIASKVNVDPKRVYLIGHSNGGFMSHRMACDHAGRVAAIVSLAGATFVDPFDCGASEPVSVLQIHGDADETILYEGGTTTQPYPSAAETVAFWAGRAGCDGEPVIDPVTLDLDGDVPGAETTVADFSGCDAGVDVSLWTLVGGAHVPAVTPAFSEGVVAWLLAHEKP
ncbi:MAG: hypothetical protein IPG04_27680 [Polyangiaceae bacterium]|nr:hypothetical protein [Polyangiaceae bacterium]